ncbi:uncharacterized protein EV422DRAFT_565188 [Fimicolochytrium jonesii]|uniref:uncharacterized protein n=1 Tax=Fimicolochytrium jonesii TaxID=1396493 RepID=UPI0022FDB70D|nr:uncharacterized protein EV422DRAFT_565188 [Fimicolochytrium jonesii]KAI8824500.1 hypothetical protein EV422DRAFT_565188 [Fimicolochytrium jonesii]
MKLSAIISVLAVTVGVFATPIEPEAADVSVSAAEIEAKAGTLAVTKDCSKIDALRVRSRPGGGTILGQLQKGQCRPFWSGSPVIVSGSSYTACGGTSSNWEPIKFTLSSGTVKGYVATLCTEWK